MKKRFLIFILMITLLSFIIVSSCKKKENNLLNLNQINDSDNNINANGNTNKIQLWYWSHTYDSVYFDSVYFETILRIVDSAKEFCNKNNIPLEILGYDESKLSFKDYIIKRNIAAASGNMIIIGDLDYMQELSKQHADYYKIDNYENLLNVYKDRFCIPLGTNFLGGYIDNKAMQYYGINPEKKVITFTDYLEIRQDMKEKGARFELNYSEFNYLINYYQNMNGLLFINEESEVLRDNGLFKKMLKKTILDVCSDFLLYYDNNNLKYTKRALQSPIKYQIYDKSSNLTLERDSKGLHSLLLPNSYDRIEDISNKTFYFDPFTKIFSANFYMYKKITNEKIYDLANHIVNEETYLMINKDNDKNYILNYIPVFNINKSKEILGVNDNLEFIEEYQGSPEIKKIISDAYKILIKDEESSKEIADYHYMNNDYQNLIKFFIIEALDSIAYELSGDELSLEKFDPENEYINKTLDKKINEFVINLGIHNN